MKAGCFHLFVHFGHDITLSIRDVGGKVLLSTTVHSSTTYNYNVSRLKAEQYVLRVQSTEQVQTLRFVKE